MCLNCIRLSILTLLLITGSVWAQDYCSPYNFATSCISSQSTTACTVNHGTQSISNDVDTASRYRLYDCTAAMPVYTTLVEPSGLYEICQTSNSDWTTGCLLTEAHWVGKMIATMALVRS